jgi:hypothetical protein
MKVLQIKRHHGSNGIGSSQAHLLALLVGLSLIRGVMYGAITPPWQAPDEPKHFEHIVLLYKERRPVTTADASPAIQREIISSMWMHDYPAYYPYFRSIPAEPPASFRDVWWDAITSLDQPPLYYVVAALPYLLVSKEDIVIRLYTARLVSAVMGTLTVAFAFLIGKELFPTDAFFQIAIPMFVTFVPMHSFIAASVNNDNLVNLLVSGLLYILLLTFKRGLSWVKLLVLGVFLVLATQTKRTGYIGLPLVLVALSIHAWRVIGRKSSIRKKLVLIPSVVLLLGGMVMLLFIPGNSAGWAKVKVASGTRCADDALFGSYSICVGDRTEPWAFIYQAIGQPDPRNLGGKTVTLGAWVRSETGSQQGWLRLYDGVGYYRKAFTATNDWQFCSLQAILNKDATQLRIDLSPGDVARLYYDGLVLAEGLYSERVTPIFADSLLKTGTWGNQPFLNLAENGSGEIPSLSLRPRIAQALVMLRLPPSAIEFVLDRKFYTTYYANIFLRFVKMLFIDFWANFGWLALPLNRWWYLVIAIASVTSQLGLIVFVLRIMRSAKTMPAWQIYYILLSVACVVLAVGWALLRQTPPHVARPQGRYLYTAVIPFGVLFMLGLFELVPRPHHRNLLLACFGGFLLLDSVSLFCYIIPFFYH